MALISFEDHTAKIKVIGIGQAGNKILENIISSELIGVECILIDTDKETLHNSKATNLIQLKSDVIDSEEKNLIIQSINGSDLLFITAGMGGSTGTEIATKIAEISKELGLLTLGVISSPFKFEGESRYIKAIEGIETLKTKTDALIILSDSSLLKMLKSDAKLIDAYQLADEILKTTIQGISNTLNLPGLVNLELVDINAIFKYSDTAHIGYGAFTGANCAMEASMLAVECPLLEGLLDKSHSILINITCGDDISLTDLYEAIDYIKSNCYSDALVMFGISTSESLKETVNLTLIATAFERSYLNA